MSFFEREVLDNTRSHVQKAMDKLAGLDELLGVLNTGSPLEILVHYVLINRQFISYRDAVHQPIETIRKRDLLGFVRIQFENRLNELRKAEKTPEYLKAPMRSLESEVNRIYLMILQRQNFPSFIR